MRAYDMLNIITDLSHLLSAKEREFCAQMAGLVVKGKELSLPQHNYLTACYDKAVSLRYGVEPMSTDREFAAKRAISNARKRRGK